MGAGELTVTCSGLDDIPALEAEWRELESRAHPTVFLSWQWLGLWLQVYSPAAKVLRVRERDRLVGIGLLVETEEVRHGVLRSRCLRLHQTGERVLDQIWIEYNGFLAEQGYQLQVMEACLAFLCNQMTQWDEFVIGAIDSEEAASYAAITGLHAHIRWEAPCYGVDLNALRLSGRSYLDGLSRNTRYQIRRSQRLYEARGALRLVRPDSLEEALAVFDSIGPLHLERWGSGPDESGFANPDFVRFHRAMIEEQWPQGGVDLVRMVVEDENVAVFYNLLYDKVVYFYLGGMHSENDNRLHPGLLGHALCIEDYRHHGFTYYDFMGGDERYKSNMGHLHRNLVQISLQRDRLKLKIEDAARRARNKWLGAVKTGPAS